MTETQSLRLSCLQLAHSKIQPREAPADTVAKAENYYEFCIAKDPEPEKVVAPTPGKDVRYKKKK